LAGRLVRSPSAELSGVPEAPALHVVVSHLDDELGAEGLPREILALAPAALAARHALELLARLEVDFAGPLLPGVIDERVGAVRSEEAHELGALGRGEARAHAHVLQMAPVIVEAEQERADQRPLAAL